MGRCQKPIVSNSSSPAKKKPSASRSCRTGSRSCRIGEASDCMLLKQAHGIAVRKHCKILGDMMGEREVREHERNSGGKMWREMKRGGGRENERRVVLEPRCPGDRDNCIVRLPRSSLRIYSAFGHLGFWSLQALGHCLWASQGRHLYTLSAHLSTSSEHGGSSLTNS